MAEEIIRDAKRIRVAVRREDTDCGDEPEAARAGRVRVSDLCLRISEW